jgi:WD40 repeat protein
MVTDLPASPGDFPSTDNAIAQSARSGGVEVAGQQVSISGDVVGRDKIVQGYTAEQVSALIAQLRTTFEPRPFDGRCPYLGLAYFDEDSADLFFGRESIVKELVERMKAARCVFITGPSGSGKSSIARAGLLRALKQGAVSGSEHWLYEAMRPGRDPLDELARVASSLAGSLNAGDDIRSRGQTDSTILHAWAEIALKDNREHRALILIDQFEETFTQVTREPERAAFLKLLTYAATVETGRVTIVFVMRSDFVSNCAAYPQLNALLNQQFLQVGAMTPAELVSAIAQPALRVGLKVEPDLVAQIIADTKGEPGALPLVQFALKDLFDAQQAAGGVIALTLAGYFERGGIHKALERHADASFAQLSAGERRVAQDIFSGLIHVGRGAEDTRRTAMFDELVPAGVDRTTVETVVGKLADARLIITDEQNGRDIVTISHEKLIDAWPWLRKLVNENRDAIALQNQIAEDAQAWDKNQRDASYLYAGARLANAREQLAARKIVLSGLAQAFVTAGAEAEEANRRREAARIQKELDDARKLAESEKQRATEQARSAAQLRQRALYLVGALLIALVLGIAAGVFGVQSNQAANVNATLAVQNAAIAGTAQAASTQAVAEAGTRTVAEAEAVKQRDEAQRQARLALSRQLASQAVNELERQLDLSLLLSIEAYRADDTPEARGSLLAALLKSPRLRTYLHAEGIGAVPLAFSGDGRWLAAGGDDCTVKLYDVSDANDPRPIGLPLRQHRDGVVSLTFDRDQHWLASGSQDGTVILWDVSQPSAPVPFTLTVSSFPSRAVAAFQHQAPVLATVSDSSSVAFWKITGASHGASLGPPVIFHQEGVDDLAFSGDDQLLALTTGFKIEVWDVSDLAAPQLKASLSGGSGAGPLSLAFGGTGRLLAVAFSTGDVLVWNLAQPESPVRSAALTGEAVAFSADGRTLAISEGGKIVLWDMNAPQTPVQVGSPAAGNNESAYSLAFSPTGNLLAGTRGGDIILWDASPTVHWSIELASVPTDFTPAMAFSPDYGLLATGQTSSTLLWDVSDPERPERLSSLPADLGSVNELAFGPDSRELVIAHQTGTQLWDVSNPRVPQRLIDDWPAEASVAFSPIAPVIVGGGRDQLTIWDVSNLREPVVLTETASPGLGVQSVAFRLDGRLLATGSRDGSIVLWDFTRPGAPTPIGPPLAAQPGFATGLAFSPNGRVLSSAMADPFASNTVRLWDVSQPAEPRALGTAIEGVFTTAFSPDGRTLLTSNEIAWDVSDPRLPIQLGKLFLSRGQVSAAFGKAGDTLVTYNEDTGLVIWDMRVESWLAQACRIAHRSLSEAEWQRYIGTTPYRPTCEARPPVAP